MTTDSRSLTRFTPANSCPICGGHDRDPRGAGVRCWGFLSSDGAYAHCTRDELAGALAQNTNSGTYAHRLTGDCRCGTAHNPAAFTPRASSPSIDRQRRRSAPPAAPLGEPTAIYDYRDADGELRYQVLRYANPKTFRQRRPDGHGGWIGNLDGVEPLLYRLPQVLAADPWAPVFKCEGEKDVDRLSSLGLVATCNSGGAGKWRPEHSEALRGRALIALSDNDDTGRSDTEQVARISVGSVASVRVLALEGLPEHGDVSDWLDAGGTPAELLRRAADVAPIMPTAPPNTGPCADQLAAKDAEIDQLKAALRDAGERLRLSLGLDRNSKIKAQRTTVKAIAFELQCAYDAGRADPDRWVKVWNPGLAQNAGTNEDRVIAHTKVMVRDGLIEKKIVREPHTRIDPETGEIVADYSRPPMPRVYLRCASVTDLFTTAATWEPSPEPERPTKKGWGGRRERCPACGSEQRRTCCATCGHPFQPDPQDADQGTMADEEEHPPAVSPTYDPQDADQGDMPPLTPLQAKVLSLAGQYGYRAVTITRDTHVGPGVDDWIGWVTTEATDGRLQQAAGILAARAATVGAAS